MVTIDEAIKKILYHYGVQRQKLKLVEEMSKLILEIAKSPESMITDTMVSKIADVQIVLTQICGASSPTQKSYLDDITAYKIRRQLTRMEGE